VYDPAVIVVGDHSSGLQQPHVLARSWVRW
jgi:hypothetical protein